MSSEKSENTVKKEGGVLSFFDTRTVLFCLIITFIAVLGYYEIYLREFAELLIFMLIFSIGTMVANSYRYTNEKQIVFLGTAYVFIGFFDFFHFWSSTNGILESSITSNMWIAARLIEAVTLMIIAIFPNKLENVRKTVLVYTIVALVVFFGVYLISNLQIAKEFLKGYSINTEFIQLGVIILEIIAFVCIIFNRKKINKYMFVNIGLFILLITTATALHSIEHILGVPTTYISMVVRGIALFLIYKLVVKSNLVAPYEALIDDLNEKNIELLKFNNDIEEKNKKLLEENEKSLLSQQRINNIAAELQQIVDIIPDGIRIISMEGIVLKINKSFERMTGFTDKELVGYSCTDSFGKQECNTGKCFRQRILDGERFIECDVKKKDKENNEKNFRVTVKPFKNANGEIVGILENFRNVEEKKNLQEKIGALEEYYIEILNDFPSMIWKAGKDARCNFVNKKWLEFTGRTREEEIGDGWVDIIYPEDLENYMRTYLEKFHSHTAFSMECRILRKDGEYRWIKNMGYPFNGTDGSFSGFIGVCYDITEEMKIKTDINEKCDETREDSHEKSKEDVTEYSGTKPDMEKIIESTEGSKELLDDLIDYFIEKIPLQIEELLDEVKNMDRKKIKENAHKIKGGVLNFGVLSAGAALMQIEKEWETISQERAEALVEKIKEEIDYTVKYLKSGEWEEQIKE